jgi:hypothetical protein
LRLFWTGTTTLRQVRTVKEIPSHQISTRIWTSPVTNGLNFLRQGGKTGGAHG